MEKLKRKSYIIQMLKLLFKNNNKKDTFQMLSIRFKINKGSVFLPIFPSLLYPSAYNNTWYMGKTQYIFGKYVNKMSHNIFF